MGAMVAVKAQHSTYICRRTLCQVESPPGSETGQPQRSVWGCSGASWLPLRTPALDLRKVCDSVKDQCSDQPFADPSCGALAQLVAGQRGDMPPETTCMQARHEAIPRGSERVQRQQDRPETGVSRGAVLRHRPWCRASNSRHVPMHRSGRQLA